MNRKFWNGKRVFLTGHTGFKGGWLSLWLNELGAEVHGFSLKPPTAPNFFNAANIDNCLASSVEADILNVPTLLEAMRTARPEIVIHMAAQPLVRDSYKKPVDTFAVNVIGTINLMEAVRKTPEAKVLINVTTDKCYENREWVWGYRENEPLGGYDPYSASKACAEIATAAWRRSFLQDSGIAVVTVRAGNVIGGGDWGTDRIIPDFFRALDARMGLDVRSPQAIRPWQHVLEPLAGYLALAEKLYVHGSDYSGAWNFGPVDTDTRSVQWIVDYLCSLLPEASWRSDSGSHAHEAFCLKLDSSKAKNRLGWSPRWRIDTALAKTVEWYNAWKNKADMRSVCLEQIIAYERMVD